MTYQEYKALGICTCCRRAPANPGRILCESCSQKRREYDKMRMFNPEAYRRKERQIMERRAQRKAAHKCVKCGVDLEDGYQFVNCPECREKQRLACREHRERMKAEL